MIEKNVEKELKTFVIFTAIAVWGQAIVAYVLSATTAGTTAIFGIDVVISLIATLLIYMGYRMIRIML